MKNFGLVSVAILFMAPFFLFTSSCDKDESTAGPTSDMTLAGIWEATKMIWEYQGETGTYTENQLDSLGLVWTFNIKEDGTMEQTTNISGPLVTFQGTWEASANQLTMNLTGPGGEEGTMVYEYAIDGNILKLSWSIPSGTKFYTEFTRQE
jgi:hypothetical protein